MREVIEKPSTPSTEKSQSFYIEPLSIGTALQDLKHTYGSLDIPSLGISLAFSNPDNENFDSCFLAEQYDHEDPTRPALCLRIDSTGKKPYHVKIRMAYT